MMTDDDWSDFDKNWTAGYERLKQRIIERRMGKRDEPKHKRVHLDDVDDSGIGKPSWR